MSSICAGQVGNARRSAVPIAGAALVAMLLASASLRCCAADPAELRGFFYNPWVNDEVQGDAWLKRYHLHQEAVDQELKELVVKTGINFIDIQGNWKEDLVKEVKSAAAGN